ncbi:MAG TPA: type II toxin-antitoxin system RelE/ParE family toxin [Cytophagaceae bacterium]|jgi:toxin ParE1/3/4|nr:type II toxin-antitoxin system RelE/ParE family toxin [Cytophagaceae bacterium]
MNKAKVTFTPFALNCIKEIFDYTFEQSKSDKIAQKLVDSILKKIKLLIHHPELGKQEELLIDTKKIYRFIIDGNYKILYRIIDNNNIVITDVFHTKQNPDKIKTREKNLH